MADTKPAPTSAGGVKSPRRRREVLDAAARVFYEKGYDASSTQDIADDVGILKGSLYYYVDSKEQFLFEIITEAHDLGLAILDELEGADGDVIERMNRLVDLHVAYFAANFVKVNVFFREFRALSPDNRKHINELGHLYRGYVEKLIRQGQAEGAFNADLDPQLSAIMLVEMLNSVVRWFHPDGKASPEQITAHAKVLLLQGLTATA